MDEDISREQVPADKHRRYTVAVYHTPLNLHYIAIPPAIFSQYISTHLGRVMDAYVGYCSRLNLRVPQFDAEWPARPRDVDYGLSVIC